MQTHDLAAELKRRYRQARHGEQVVAIDLLGIEYAEHLSRRPLKEICILADISEAYATELSKARKLASHVELRK